MRIPVMEMGGGSPGSIVHLAPANGIPYLTYQPIVEALSEAHRVVAIPPRALWPGMTPPPDRIGTWEELVDDLVAGFEEHSLRDVIAIGHSFGAVVSLMAAVRHRSRFRGICLLDPTILSPAMMRDWAVAKSKGWQPPHPLAPQSRNRKAKFASREEAFRFWRERRLFADWTDDAVWRYVDGALVPDGDGLRLAWSPAWEAYYYEAFYPETWDEIARLDRTLPVLVVGGGDSDVWTDPARLVFAERVPWARMALVEGHGHLFPQTAPGQTITLIEAWLDQLAS